MAAVLLTGHGGLDKLEYRTDVPVPRPASGEVLIEVLGRGHQQHRRQHSDRVVLEGGRYGDRRRRAAGYGAVDTGDAAWSGAALEFPRIQGADVCGRIVEVGEGVPGDRIGERVIVRTMLRTPVDYRPFECWTLGSECDGGFAQFTVAPSAEACTRAAT